MRKYFLLLIGSCLIFTACVNKNVDQDGHPLIFCKCQDLPFKKKQIQEINLYYWVRVRDEGVYAGIYDSGIRKRIFVIDDKERAYNLLSRLSVLEMEKISRKQNVNIVFKSKTEQWPGEILSKKEMTIGDNRIVQFDSNFENFARMLCTYSEKCLREIALCDERVYVDPEWISFSREEAFRLEKLKYEPRCDGISEKDVREFDDYSYGE